MSSTLYTGIFFSLLTNATLIDGKATKYMVTQYIYIYIYYLSPAAITKCNVAVEGGGSCPQGSCQRGSVWNSGNCLSKNLSSVLWSDHAALDLCNKLISRTFERNRH